MPKQFKDLLSVILSTMVDQGLVREGKVEKLTEKVSEKMQELQETWDEKEIHRKEVADLKERLGKSEDRGIAAEKRFDEKEEVLTADCEARIDAIEAESAREIAQLTERLADKEGALIASAESKVRKELNVERGVLDGVEATCTALKHANDFLKEDAVELRKQNEEVRKDYKAIVEKALETSQITGVAQVFTPQPLPRPEVKRK